MDTGQTEFLSKVYVLTWRAISSKGKDWDRHCLAKMPISISAIFSQGAWIGV